VTAERVCQLDREMTTGSDAQRRLRRRHDSEQEDSGQELE